MNKNLSYLCKAVSLMVLLDHIVFMAVFNEFARRDCCFGIITENRFYYRFMFYYEYTMKCPKCKEFVHCPLLSEYIPHYGSPEYYSYWQKDIESQNANRIYLNCGERSHLTFWEPPNGRPKCHTFLEQQFRQILVDY